MADKYVVVSTPTKGARVGLADLADANELHALMVKVTNFQDMDNPLEWAVSDQSDPDDPLVITKLAPGEGKAHVITALEVLVLEEATADVVLIMLKDGTDILWQTAIESGAIPGTKLVMTGLRLECTENTDVSLESSAGGTDCEIVLNLMGYTREV